MSGGVTLLGDGNKITGSISADGKTLTIVSGITGGISVEKCTYTLTK